MTTTVQEMTGLRKAAVLLVQLGKDHSAQVLKSLREPEVEILTAEIARLEESTPTWPARSCASSRSSPPRATTTPGRPGVRRGGARRHPRPGQGAGGAGPPQGRTRRDAVPVPASGRAADGAVVPAGRAPADHHPRPRAHGSQAGRGGPERPARAGPGRHRPPPRRHGPTSADIVKQVKSHLQRRLSTVLQPNESAPVGGLQPLVDIINHSDRSTERLILEGLEQRSSELAEEVRRAHVHVRGHPPARGPGSAGAAAVHRHQGPGGRSQGGQGGRAREVRREHVGAGRCRARRGHGRARPVRVKQVEEAQAAIIRQVRALEESGDIVVSRGAGDDFVL